MDRLLNMEEEEEVVDEMTLINEENDQDALEFAKRMEQRSSRAIFHLNVFSLLTTPNSS